MAAGTCRVIDSRKNDRYPSELSYGSTVAGVRLGLGREIWTSDVLQYECGIGLGCETWQHTCHFCGFPSGDGRGGFKRCRRRKSITYKSAGGV